MLDPKAAVEAALFVSSKPLSLEEIARGLHISEEEVHRALEEIARELEAPDRGLELFQERGGYLLRVKEELVEAVRPFSPEGEIPEPVLRTLALIAYRGPIRQADVVRIRGQRAYAHIRELIQRGFVKARPHGNTKVLEVTKDFLEYFGLSSPQDFRSSWKTRR